MSADEPLRPRAAPVDLYAEVTGALKEIASLAARGWGSDQERDEALARINELALRLPADLQDR